MSAVFIVTVVAVVGGEADLWEFLLDLVRQSML
jgi:hypothetical protein